MRRMEVPSTEMGEAKRGAGRRKEQEFKFGHALSLAFIRILSQYSVKELWLPGTLYLYKLEDQGNKSRVEEDK